MGAIESTGILNTQGQIQLDHPIPQEKDRFVCVILLMSEDELKEKNWLDAVSYNPRFAFLHDPEVSYLFNCSLDITLVNLSSTLTRRGEL